MQPKLQMLPLFQSVSIPTRKWGFANWDTFYLEKPFGKIYIQYGEPIFFDKKLDFDECSQILIEKMHEIENIYL